MDLGLVTCEGCKKTVSMNEIKYVPKGKEGRTSLCRACLARNNIEIKETSVRELQPKLERSSNNDFFYCEKCRYKFKSSKDKPVCGYCGKADRVVPV